MKSFNFQRHHLVYVVFFIALLTAAISLFMYWHQIIRQVIEWQKTFHELLAVHINSIKENPVEHGLSLIMLSFGYGVFHAIGPGHGKAVIITYLSSHKESLKRGLMISFLAALLQAFVAVLLVVVLAKLFSIRYSDVNGYADNVTSASYFLVMGLGAYLLLSASRQLWKQFRQHNSGAHSHCCGGHHTHQAEVKESWLQSLMVIISMGSRPCSGAIVVLIYAHLVDAFSYGVMATLAMGVGTGSSIAAIGLGTQLARNWFESIIKVSHEHGKHSYHIGSWLKIVGGLVILLLGYSLLQTTMTVGQSHPLL